MKTICWNIELKNPQGFLNNRTGQSFLKNAVWRNRLFTCGLIPDQPNPSRLSPFPISGKELFLALGIHATLEYLDAITRPAQSSSDYRRGACERTPSKSKSSKNQSQSAKLISQKLMQADGVPIIPNRQTVPAGGLCSRSKLNTTKLWLATSSHFSLVKGSDAMAAARWLTVSWWWMWGIPQISQL